MARFLRIVGGTEQQCHSFKDYTRGSVSNVLKRQISNLSVHILALKSLTADTILLTLCDGVYHRIAIPVVVRHSKQHL